MAGQPMAVRKPRLRPSSPPMSAALFGSGLQRSDAPAADAVAEVISRTVRQFGIRGCAEPNGPGFR